MRTGRLSPRGRRDRHNQHHQNSTTLLCRQSLRKMPRTKRQNRQQITPGTFMASHDRPSDSWPDSGTCPDELLVVATDAARQAGAVLNAWAGRFTVSEKSPANLVTEADLAAQDSIHAMIHGRYRDHNF